MGLLRLPRSAFFLVGGSAGFFAATIGVSLVLAGVAGQYALRSADSHARAGTDLLVGVGPQLPALTADQFRRGFTASEAAELNAAVAAGRRDGLLSGLTVWDRSGHVVYSSDTILTARVAPPPADVQAALGGANVVAKHPGEVDHAQRQAQGVLDALQPLRGAHGRVFGAVEISLPLQPIEADAASFQRRILLFLLGGALLVWLVSLPFAARASRTLALAWVPGRTRTRRTVIRALAQGRIVLVYQPQVSPTDGTCHAVEALVRMRVGDHLRSPDTFLPHIEGSSIDQLVCQRVLDLALAQLAVWHAQGFTLRMSVNLSAANIADPKLPETVAIALGRHRCHPDDLTLEITETGVLQDVPSTAVVIDKLSALGVDLAVDDFGTGHSSISRLHQLPVQEVKIDRSFVMNPDQRSRAYVAAMIGFASQLGLRVVAEGVEDADTLAYLSDLHCDLVQGYFLSRPLPAADITRWLANTHQTTATIYAA